MRDNLISVIVPVYNTSKYIPRCIESIINQTYKNIEIIIINDGSSDNSKEICCKYIDKNNNIVFIDKENQGVSSARNSGLLKANGNYVMFVDSDDELPIDAIEILSKSIFNEGVDIIVGDYSKIDENNIIKKRDFVCNDKKNSFIEFITDNFMWEPWGKLYKREKVINLFDNNIFVAEDILFLVENFSNATYKYVDEIVYLYRINSTSIMNCKTINSRNITQFNAIDKIVGLLSDDRKYFFIKLYINLLLNVILNYKDSEKIFKSHKNMIINNAKKYINDLINKENISKIEKIKYFLKYTFIRIKMG